MKISLEWLKEYIPLTQSPEQISEILTAIGLEVEGMEDVESIPGGLRQMVIGHVKSCVQHPNADKLKICQVDTGEDHERQIICGAPNVAADQKVVVALPGALIYTDPEKPFKIKKSKIRGEESAGMICAEDELALGSGHDGIMVLPEDSKVGQPAADYFDVRTDTVYDIGLTPNRSDATSHMGVARDLLAYLRTHHDGDLEMQKPTVPTAENQGDTPVDIQIIATDHCPRYAGAVLEDIQIGASPDWIRTRLQSIGVKSINNVVDITNYILHEYGQPLHAFDLDQIQSETIKVQFLPEGTKFITLDEKNISLRETDLMITDGNDNGLCMAGVFGGKGSGVTDSTTRIFLESAHFDAKSIRVTSMKHNLRTDAAMVFEKGSDPQVVLEALSRACSLLQKYAGAKLVGGLKDIISVDKDMPEITVRWKRIDALIGNKIEKETSLKILKALEFQIVREEKDHLIVKPSTSRVDVLREADVIEEILRIYGFNNIEISDKANFTLIPGEALPLHRFRNRMADLLVGRGFLEIMGLSLMPETELNKLSLNEETFVKINNTSNVHLNVMRPDLLLSGLETVRYNLNRSQSDLRLFEFGRAYGRASEDGYDEKESISLILSGSPEANWKRDSSQYDVYSLKSEVHYLLGKIGLDRYQVSALEEDPKYAYGLKYHQGKQVLAEYGQIKPSIAAQMGIDVPVYGALLNLKLLRDRYASHSLTAEQPSKYPSTSRDLALLMDADQKYDDVVRLCHKASKRLLESVSLFDYYIDEEMENKGQKSYAIRLKFSDKEKTLKDKEVDKMIHKITSSLQRQMGIEIRK